MTVTLFPPYTSSLPRPVADPLAEAPEFVRTAGMSRWHRPRSGVAYPDGRRHYDVWCGYGVGTSNRAGSALAVDVRTDDLPVCATCDGRAVGAGQITDGPSGRVLAFTPRYQTPPRWCPGSRSYVLYEALPGGTVGRCLACGDMHPLRAMGGPYAGGYGITQHPPGAALLAPCPWHAWRQFTATAGRPHCACGQPLTTAREDT